METNSAADTGRGTSNAGVGKAGGVGRSQGDSMSSSSVLGVGSGDGEGNGTERLSRKLKGALWGRGEMSIESGTKQGDDEGIGGVVTPSHLTAGVRNPSASAAVSTRCPNTPLTKPLTPCVYLMEQVRCEERPTRRCELGTATKKAISQN